MRIASVALVLLVGLLASGCSDDDSCRGRAYQPDLSVAGEPTPIRALEVWLGSHEGFDQPPDDGWVVQDEGDPERVVITNDADDGWWVATVRTEDGGYVVGEATDDAARCGDQLS